MSIIVVSVAEIERVLMILLGGDARLDLGFSWVSLLLTEFLSGEYGRIGRVRG